MSDGGRALFRRVSVRRPPVHVGVQVLVAEVGLETLRGGGGGFGYREPEGGVVQANFGVFVRAVEGGGTVGGETGLAVSYPSAFEGFQSHDLYGNYFVRYVDERVCQNIILLIILIKQKSKLKDK